MAFSMSHEPSGMKSVSIIIPMYRDAERAIELIRSLKRQELPPGVEVEVIVVDDGSEDGSGELIERAVGDAIMLRRLPCNSGRAVARNSGAAIAQGGVLLFLDCDCLPDGHDFIAAHLRCWLSGVVATTGSVTGRGDGFWHRYQTEASDRRQRQFQQGISFSGSSQNLMVARAVFESCGGFDPAYTTYGFEDRDLLLRLATFGRVAWAEARVMHMDALALASVCQKMTEAGGSAADLFARSHPDAYQSLGYARLDARRHFWLVLCARLAGWLIGSAARAVDRILDVDFVPYPIKKMLVKGLTAFSYVAGTARHSVSPLHPD